MKAVILAAGEGTRLRPLTTNTPKPLVKLNEKPLLDYTLEILPAQVDELIIVIGYLGQQIIDYVGDDYHGKKVSYVWQHERKGTFCALALCKEHLQNGRFIFLHADDLIDANALKKMIEHDGLSLMVMPHVEPQRFGVVEINPNHSIKQIVEKPPAPQSTLVNVGPAVLDERIFHYPPAVHSNGEQYLAEAIGFLAQHVTVQAMEAKEWTPIGYPADILAVERRLRMYQ